MLEKAKNAKISTEKANVKENIQVQVLNSFDRNGNINLEKLTKNLSKLTNLLYNNKKVDPNDNPITSLPIDVELNGYTAHIDERGNVTLEGEDIEEDPNPGPEPDPVKPVSPKVIDIGSYVLVFDVKTNDGYEKMLTYSNPIESENISQKVVIQKKDIPNASNETEIYVTCIYCSPNLDITGSQDLSDTFEGGKDKVEFDFDFAYSSVINTVETEIITFSAD